MRFRVWLDHVLYSDIFEEPWVWDARVRTVMADGSRIWTKYKHGSDHFPITTTVVT